MARTSLRRITGALAAALTGAAAVAVVTTAPAGAAAAEPVATPAACSQQGSVSKTLENGTSWSMCWNLDSKKGLVLESVMVKAPGDSGYRRVLDSIALAQLNVPYDSGQHQWNDITSYGFGNQYLQKVDESECPDGELIDVQQAWLQRSGTTNAYVERTIPAICVQEVATGLSYRSHEQDWGSVEDELLFTEQGTELVISTIAKVDWYEYQSQYRFTDSGTIAARLGATGDISPEDFADPAYGWPVGAGDTDHASSHHHNAFWRVDFGIDGASSQKVRMIDSEVTGSGERAPVLTSTITPIETARTLDMQKRRIYNVYAPGSLNEDQHPRGYEIEFEENDPYEGIPETAPEVTFTQYNACHEFATQNQNPSCALQSVLDYASGGATLTNPVAWVNVGFHHLVRDEDQSPMPVHWQGFELVARDFWARNPLAPTARDCVNGEPGGQIDSTTACGHATSTGLALSAPAQETGTSQPVTATVTVAQASEGGEVPEGTVSLVDGANLVASGEVDGDGRATLTLPADLAVGTHSLVAVFAPADGTAWQTSSSAPVTFTVTRPDPVATRTAVALSRSTVTTAQRAAVKVRVSATPTPTGTVTVYAGSRKVGTGRLKAGVVTVSLPRLAVGTYRVKASYAGSATSAPSTSPSLVLRVVRP